MNLKAIIYSVKLINSNIKNYKYSWYWVKNTATGIAFAKYSAYENNMITSELGFDKENMSNKNLNNIFSKLEFYNNIDIS